MDDAKWTQRLSKWAFRIAVAAPLIAGVALTLARYDIIPKIGGLYAMMVGALVAAVALLLAIIGLIMALRFGATTKRLAMIALAISGAYLGYMASRAAVARSVPPIHDITTDLVDPPAFSAITLRSDNLVGVGTTENWRAIHARTYGDLDSVTIARPAATVIADAERLARANGWEVAAADAASGRVEATASVSFIRFKDDVVIRVRPSADGASSVVDMRSVSRIGVSDLGVNAVRIRTFLADLSRG